VDAVAYAQHVRVACDETAVDEDGAMSQPLFDGCALGIRQFGE
jgi:hypothetical protein